MTRRRDADHVLRSWIDEGIDVAPEKSVHDALRTVHTTRQRRELALLRRIRPMDTMTATLRLPAVRMGAVAAAVLVLLVGAALVTSFLPRVGGEPSTSLTDLLAGLEAPAGTVATQTLSGDEALLDIFETTSIATHDLELPGYEDAASVTFDRRSSPTRFTAAVMSFADEATAADAFYSIYRSARNVSVGPIDGGIGFWNLGPGVAVPFTADGGDLQFELTGSWVSFGGTSAYESARAGLLLAWREGDRIHLSAGIDRESVGTAALQAEIEAGVRALAETP